MPHSALNASARAVQRLVNIPLARLFGVELGLRRSYPAAGPDIEPLRSSFPERDWRRSITLPFGAFDPDREELFVVHKAGLFSCLSVTLWCVCDLLASGRVPKSINFTGTLLPYKERPEVDLYPDLFQSDLSTGAVDALSRWHPSRLEHFDHHGDYGELDLELLTLLTRAYLRPSAAVTDRAEHLRSQYLVPDQRYVGVCVRGTDKTTEVQPTDSSMYVDVVEQLLTADKVDRVLIQTDQAQVCDLFRMCFGDRCDVFEEIPRTRGQIPMHQLEPTGRSPADGARDLVAAVSILSTMTHVVTHTGNIGAWIVIQRGSVSGVHQATPGGLVAL